MHLALRVLGLLGALALLLATGVALAAPPGQETPPTNTPEATIAIPGDLPTSTPAEPAPPTATPALPAGEPTATVLVPSPTQVSNEPAVVPSVTPLFPIGEPPLSLSIGASSGAVLPGDIFEYTILVSTTRPGAVVEVAIQLPAGLTLVGVSGAACSGSVVCQVQFGSVTSQPITISTRVSADVAPNTTLVGRALAQDDQSFTASSQSVVVIVLALPAVDDTALPVRPTIDRPDPTEPPREDSDPTATPTHTPIATAPPAPPAEPDPTKRQLEPAPAEATTVPPALDPPVEPSPVTPETRAEEPPAPPSSGQPALEEGPPARVAEEVEPSAVRAALLLPNTAAISAPLGIGLLLCGLALTITAARRIRRASRLMQMQEHAASLGPLIRILASRQRRSSSVDEELNKRVEHIQQMIDDGRKIVDSDW
jgi:hypothetical protein